MSRLAVNAIGLVTPVGLNARSSAAALRAGIVRFAPLPFHDAGGIPIVGARVRKVAEGLMGVRRYASLVAAALRDAERQLDEPLPRRVPLVLGVAPRERPGRPALERDIAALLEAEGGWEFDPDQSALVSSGNTAAAHALERAREILARGASPMAVVACVDSFVNGPALGHLEASGRLKTEADPDGVIPSEAAGALVVTRAGDARGRALLDVAGIGFASDPAAGDDRPNVGEGLARAIRACLSDARLTTRETHFRLSDVSGDRNAFKEAQYALARTLGESHAEYPLWLPSESYGETGAASGVAQLAVAAAAFAKGYAPGSGALCQLSSESGERAALVVRPG